MDNFTNIFTLVRDAQPLRWAWSAAVGMLWMTLYSRRPAYRILDAGSLYLAKNPETSQSFLGGYLLGLAAVLK